MQISPRQPASRLGATREAGEGQQTPPERRAWMSLKRGADSAYLASMKSVYAALNIEPRRLGADLAADGAEALGDFEEELLTMSRIALSGAQR